MARGGDADTGTLLTILVALLVALPFALAQGLDPGELWPFALARLLGPGSPSSCSRSRSATRARRVPRSSSAPRRSSRSRSRSRCSTSRHRRARRGRGAHRRRRDPARGRADAPRAREARRALARAARHRRLRGAGQPRALARGRDRRGAARCRRGRDARRRRVRVTCYLLGSRRRPALRDLPRFAPAGAAFGLSYVALFEAYYRGRVSVVSPLVATESLWGVGLSALFLRQTSRRPRLFAGAGLSSSADADRALR